MTEDDLSKIDIEDWIKMTDGMSLSHLKEVIISVIVMGKSFEETIDSLDNLKKAPRVKEQTRVGFGK